MDITIHLMKRLQEVLLDVAILKSSCRASAAALRHSNPYENSAAGGSVSPGSFGRHNDCFFFTVGLVIFRFGFVKKFLKCSRAKGFDAVIGRVNPKLSSTSSAHVFFL